ncbi:tRNA 2-selenouridine(34) synthase MnmH [Castellaniella sp. MT123]|uniref:tRNA 2-selenouridine(34) synthase MnmH n=1 Tax=Castellaniella sp. MT123 TaxID=3140381 RepID=UPI0031F424EC|nr:tRNA 2-selenouridine(34) synthase MnmH [Castellaniella sp.]
MNRPAHPPGSLRCGLESLDQFDEIIDVRTPAEYADDHIPGAINAPVLSNEERVLIGTMYAQESPFKATRLGAALVARHIAGYLETLFADRPQNWRPLIYCWRGGKRSGSMTTWFNLIGWRARQLDGGYKTWRRHVIDTLETAPARLNCIVLTGPTGSGKTRLLQALGQAGAQILDLEGLARHRGSLLGDLPEQPQPSQRGFESALLRAIDGLDPAHPVFIEAESRRIGQLSLPDALLQAMHGGRCVRVQATLPQRIEFLLQDYRHLFDAPDAFKQTLERLVGLHSRQTIHDWQTLIDADRRAELFQALVQDHYDPAYRRSSHSHYDGLAQAPVFDYDPTDADGRQQALALMRQCGLLVPTPAS